jgi:hypothetical protein
MADTGFFDHPFFALNGFRMTRENAASSGAATDDLTGHGTGTCANALAIAPDCVFVGVRMAPDTAASDALQVALAHRPQLLTLSWGWDIDGQSRESLKTSSPNQYSEMRHVEQILAAANAAGVTVVCAAGDGHRAFPGSLPWAIAVGGTTALPDGSLKASGIASSYRSQLYPGRDVPDLCGLIGDSGMLGDILLPVPPGCPADGLNLFQGKGSGWSLFSGTSAAAPQVAGVAALLLQVNPELSPGEIKDILGSTARDVTAGQSALGDAAAAGPDLATGAGLVDALAACLSAAARASSS